MLMKNSTFYSFNLVPTFWLMFSEFNKLMMSKKSNKLLGKFMFLNSFPKKFKLKLMRKILLKKKLKMTKKLSNNY